METVSRSTQDRTIRKHHLELALKSVGSYPCYCLIPFREQLSTIDSLHRETKSTIKLPAQGRQHGKRCRTEAPELRTAVYVGVYLLTFLSTPITGSRTDVGGTPDALASSHVAVVRIFRSIALLRLGRSLITQQAWTYHPRAGIPVILPDGNGLGRKPADFRRCTTTAAAYRSACETLALERAGVTRPFFVLDTIAWVDEATISHPDVVAAPQSAFAGTSRLRMGGLKRGARGPLGSHTRGRYPSIDTRL